MTRPVGNKSMKLFRFFRRQDPVAGLSWNFEETPGDGPVAGLSWHFEEAVRSSSPTDIASSVAAAHIGAAAQASRLAPVPNPARAEARTSSLRATARKRRFALGGLMTSVTAKVLVATATALAATGGAAAAGILPDPVQTVLADAAGVVGINLPSPDKDGLATVLGDDEGSVDGVDEESQSFDDDQGDDEAGDGGVVADDPAADDPADDQGDDEAGDGGVVADDAAADDPADDQGDDEAGDGGVVADDSAADVPADDQGDDGD